MRGAEPGHQQSSGLLVPGEEPGHRPGAACRAVAPRCLELELYLPGAVELYPLVGQSRPGDVAAQLLQALAVVCVDPHRGVQAEAVDVGAQGLARRGLARHCASQGEHLMPCTGAEGDSVS